MKRIASDSYVGFSWVSRNLTYGSICVVQHALICDKCWWFERFKTFRAKIEQCNFSIGQIAWCNIATSYINTNLLRDSKPQKQAKCTRADVRYVVQYIQ